MALDPIEAEECLRNMVFVADSREQPTKALKTRLRYLEPYVRETVESGDYTAKTLLPDGTWFYLPVCVERKMNAGEIAGNFSRNRGRFIAEFNRARERGTKLYILIERATWESIYAGAYRSMMKPQSLIASIFTWSARYNCPVLLNDVATMDGEDPDKYTQRVSAVSGKLIRDILHYEMREALDRMVNYGT